MSTQSSGTKALISENYLDFPSQRWYYLGFGALLQACKAVDVISSFVSSENRMYLCRKWLLFDTLYCILLALLRIPRLNYSKAVVALQIICVCFADALFFGGVSVNLWGDESVVSTSISGHHDVAYTPETTTFMDILAPFTGLFSSQATQNDAHLLGQHTVRMSPIGTAQLNPYGETLCLPPSGDAILIPVLLNNTNPVNLKFSLTPLGLKPGQPEFTDLSGKELRTIEQARVAALQLTRPASQEVVDEYDEYDDDDPTSKQSFSLQSTQSLVHIRLEKPGVLKLERVLDSSSTEARLVIPSDMIIVPCPRAEFAPDEHVEDSIRCAGQGNDVQLMMDINGVPPLRLRWSKTVNGNREPYLVEGIEGGHHSDSSLSSDHSSQVAITTSGSDRRTTAPERLQVPLSISLDIPGRHVYALEEVVDAVGNTMVISSSSSADDHTAVRSFTILRRPAVAFKHCSPEHPVSLAIGSEAALAISAIDADTLDAPWDINIKYQPHSGDSGNKRFKVWRKTVSMQGNRRDLSIGASAPGEYMITGVKGKWCAGDVLAPESCNVVERPMPTAEIKWTKIHECSGDTGVSATLVLHGTPPFHVYYEIQKDSEAPKELSKTFATSRGQFMLQPEQSGHYIFKFTKISDANYQRVAFDGPSIDQVIHPPASADFVGVPKGLGRKKALNSCEGKFIDVEVELRGSPPWSLELQLVGPRSSDILTFPDINTNRKQLQIPVPATVDKEGGTFEIDLISVEDKSRCKLPISVPGISVNVRRLKPTVKFYGADGKRQTTVLEHERTGLPLRLTGEAPWHIKYRRAGDNSVVSAKLTSPNDYVYVTEKGVYEILEISDAQCSGTVIADSSDYRVDWVPRPTAQLSEHTSATYEPLNGSYILPPLCEGINDHVDLDLTGRPPFQIMYNIAQGNEQGGTRLIDQPVFNSIQPRTRFQLHTSNPGRVYYEVKQIGDTAYPLEKHKNTPIPRNERLLFEQQVSLRPNARFKNRNRLAYCLYDVFAPLDKLSSDGLVVLEGTPPFQLELSVKNLATSHVEMQTVEVHDHAWKLGLQNYQFTSVGAHLVVIQSVADASNCAHATLDPLATSVWVDVAEAAAIVPIDRREDFCVGEAAQFQLEGTPPWSIGYRINGKAYTQEAKVSPFSLLQQQPGEFVVTSIAHQQKMCKASITDLRFSVHPLPSAQVGHGKRVLQDIHEGDQAEIVFTLIGEPPFTFTYQRSELTTGRNKHGKVLETHTVSRVYSNEYSIFSALEGTWTVTSISDRYCRYPPIQPEIGAEKARA
ncbi:hypothetical protein EV361DRAFT_393865 [Lentinula raphanica]|uniref:Nucleoporin Pom152 n=1 Tax=Lentinula raphanica TaxID=153919 RepID=A0AA38UKB8_9AGAR|nr:hypothetical protein F5878DRAFT_668689 [Lentinula raphanica]KAJ3977899.1 hypothetical protein EV361DRAFT_393865 [Lentinula raphanica]